MKNYPTLRPAVALLCLGFAWLVAAPAAEAAETDPIYIHIHCFDEVEEVDYVPIEIKNELDRSAAIDFDGAAHYETSLGDNRTSSLQVKPGGLYTIRASAAAMKTAEEQYRFVVGVPCTIVISRSKKRIEQPVG